VNSDSSLYLDEQHSDSLGVDPLSIALIGPDEDRRKAVANEIAVCQSGEICEFYSYPASLDDLPKLLEPHFDVIVIDLDCQPEYALELVESLCAKGAATVMVYSMKSDADLLVRCMRAGAREFLTLPFTRNNVAEALVRASARRSATRPPKKASGRLLVFLGAKGGDGVTTLACNFAVALAQESSQSTLLIDLDLPLGDAALNLGVVAEYSTINALQNASRLDSSFLSKLLVKHSSGVSVLAAPGKFPQFEAPNEAIDRLITVARQEFENVVVDMGSRLDLMGTGLFRDGSTVYLVIQAGIAGLRNSNRLISQYFATDVPKLEIVLNRFQSRSQGVAEDQITKALTRPAQWKIPNDYAAVRRMQHTAIPLALEDSPISRLIRQMARSACGLPAVPEKGSGFSLKKISRSISAKISSSEELPMPVQPEPVYQQENAVAVQPDVTVKAQVSPVAAPLEDAVPTSETQETSAPVETDGDVEVAVDEKAQPDESAASQQGEQETRTYMGATYAKGADGQWHLQPTQAEEVSAEPPDIAWSTPAPVAYGVALGAAQLNAMASVPGTFVYTPSEGEVLPVGVHTLSVTFTPSDAAAGSAVQTSVEFTVAQATPVITWQEPASVVYGTALSADVLNAIAAVAGEPVAGEYVYTPAAGEVLPSGVHTLSVTFTPTDAEGYATAEAAVSLTVTQATPAIAWPEPASIAFGTALSAAQLNAVASLPGSFAYSPDAGEVLLAGAHTLSATFIPADAENFARTQATVPLTVTQATPIVTWSAPAAISQGDALSPDQLNATALVPGSFVYAPDAGEVLAAGTHTLVVSFTPADAVGYTAVQAAVPLTVAPAPAIIPSAPATASQHAVSVAQLNVEPQPAVGMGAPVEAEKPADHAILTPRKASAKAVAKPPVKSANEFHAKAPAKSNAETPAKAPVLPPVKAVREHPAKALAKAPAKLHVEHSAKAPVRLSDEIPVKAAEKASAETWVKIPALPPAETPANALAQVPKPVIDVGPGLDLMGSAVFEDGTTIYLVMQPGSAGLSSSNRMVSQFFAAGGPKPDFVINPFNPHTPGVPEGQTSTALTRTTYSPISRLIGRMARPVSDLPPAPQKKTGFSLKGLGRSIWSKISSAEKTTSFTQLGLADDQDDPSAMTGAAQSAAGIPVKPAYAPPAGKPFAAGTQMPFAAAGAADSADFMGAKRSVNQSASNPYGKPETRIYQGATYVKGADGQWHLQKPQNAEVKKETPSVAWAMPAPSASAIPLGAGEFNAKSGPAPVQSAPVHAAAPAAEAKHAPQDPALAKKVPAKVAAKRRVKAAAKPAAKTPAKRQVKAGAKPAAKASAKRSVKAGGKAPAKAPAKQLVKTAAKPAAKAADKHSVKAVAKAVAKAPAKPAIKAAAKSLTKAPVRKSTPARKKPVPASGPKPAKAVKLPLPAGDKPVPEPAVNKLVPEPALNKPSAESAKKD
jgi:pilus assembly protein CpaE